MNGLYSQRLPKHIINLRFLVCSILLLCIFNCTSWSRENKSITTVYNVNTANSDAVDTNEIYSITELILTQPEDTSQLKLEKYLNSTKDNSLIGNGELWYYYDSIMPENEMWFSDFKANLNWKTGHSEFGYGDGDEATVIGYGEDPKHKHITSYFYKKFETSNPEEFLGYLINLKADDGAVVYLNGKEIWRINMPFGKITDRTRSEFRVEGENEERVQTFVLDSKLLIDGENTMAVSVHQVNSASSDCSFEMAIVRIENVEQVLQILKNQDTKLNERLAEIRDQMLISDKELELKVKEQEVQLHKLYANITIGIITVFLVTAFIVWIGLRQRNKTVVINNTLLKDELIGKNQELINMSLGQLNKNRLIHELESDLSKVVVNKDSRELANQLKNKISSYSVVDQEWENLQYHFENVHSEYFNKLRETYPTLNSTELRLCGFIRLQLTTKEIARMLSVDPRSVQTSRYRLKKKLNIPNEIDLVQFLSKFY